MPQRIRIQILLKKLYLPDQDLTIIPTGKYKFSLEQIQKEFRDKPIEDQKI